MDHLACKKTTLDSLVALYKINLVSKHVCVSAESILLTLGAPRVHFKQDLFRESFLFSDYTHLKFKGL